VPYRTLTGQILSPELAAILNTLVEQQSTLTEAVLMQTVQVSCESSAIATNVSLPVSQAASSVVNSRPGIVTEGLLAESDRLTRETRREEDPEEKAPPSS